LDGSNEKCGLPDVNGNIESVQCPKYANAACYTAATWHSVSYSKKLISKKYRKNYGQK